MARFFLGIIFLVTTIACLSGCLTAIYNSGKDLEVHGKQTRREIEAVLGEPSQVTTFSPAVDAGQIPALQYWSNRGDAARYPSLIPDPSRLVSYRTYYLYHGARRNSDETGEVAGMELGIALSTLGLSEIILLPDALEQRRLKDQDVHLFVLYYDDTDSVVASRYHYLGRSTTDEGTRDMLDRHLAAEDRQKLRTLIPQDSPHANPLR